MKINKSQTKYKIPLITVAVILLLVASYSAYAYAKNTWPFSQSQDNSETKPDNDAVSSSDAKTNNQSSPDTDSTGEASSKDSSSTNKGYVDTPVFNPPSTSDNYPIRNAHYKIAQKSDTSYAITLYPIANNPEYSDYNAQLKDYKNEALDYLKNRYGNINNFTIDWTPKYAKDA